MSQLENMLCDLGNGRMLEVLIQSLGYHQTKSMLCSLGLNNQHEVYGIMYLYL